MYTITENTNELLEALKGNYAIACSKDGCWKIQSELFTSIKSFFGFTSWNRTNLALAVLNRFDELENTPLHFFKKRTSIIPDNSSIDLVEIAELLAEKLDDKNNIIKNLLYRKGVSLKYRLESLKGGYDKTLAKSEDLGFLKKIVSEWKVANPIIDHKELTEHEIVSLFRTAQYPKFVKLLEKDALLQLEFFEWVMRDNNSVDIFVQFPALQKKMVDCNLSGRIGKMGGKQLKLKKISIFSDVYEKIVTLSMEGKDIPILDGTTTITFRGDYTLSVKEIFEVFKDKNTKVGNLEFFAQGVTNWNSHQMGWWNANHNSYERVDLTKMDWWRQLPIGEILTSKQASKKYGLSLNGINWNFATTATRASANLDYNNSHSFIEMAIPINSGRYLILDFGKFAKRLPQSFIDGLSYFTHTVPATVAYPDENIYYTHRQHAFQSFELNAFEGLEIMNSIKNDIIKSRSGNFVYQIQSDNCAKWAFEKIDVVIDSTKIPNLFKMPLLNSEPGGVIGGLFKFIKLLPKPIQVKMLTLLHLPLGAYKGSWILEEGRLVFKALTQHEFWKTGIVYLPAYLHHQQHNGSLPVALQKGVDVITHPISFLGPPIKYSLEFLKFHIIDVFNLCLSNQQSNRYRFLNRFLCFNE